MIDNVVCLAGSYAAMAAGLSAVVAKVSPSIGPRLRHQLQRDPVLTLLRRRAQLVEHRPDDVLLQPRPLGQDVVGRLAQVQAVAHRAAVSRSKVSAVRPASRSSTLRTRSVGVLGSDSITRRYRGRAK